MQKIIRDRSSVYVDDLNGISFPLIFAKNILCIYEHYKSIKL